MWDNVNFEGLFKFITIFVFLIFARISGTHNGPLLLEFWYFPLLAVTGLCLNSCSTVVSISDLFVLLPFSLYLHGFVWMNYPDQLFYLFAVIPLQTWEGLSVWKSVSASFPQPLRKITRSYWFPWFFKSIKLFGLKKRADNAVFDGSVNITIGEREERMMMTGMHTVVDIFCVGCGSIVGWKYVRSLHISFFSYFSIQCSNVIVYLRKPLLRRPKNTK